MLIQGGLVETMFVTSVEKVREYDVRRRGSKGVRVKYLLHKGVGARRLQLRLFTIDVGGYTPLEKHAHEHEVYMLTGKALVLGGEHHTVVQPGNVIFMPSNEKHQFKNIGNEPVQFLCTKETPEPFLESMS